MRKTLRERFDRWVDCGDGTGCWLWAGSKNPAGYGILTVDGKTRKAHRLALELASGPIPSGMHVLHSCDTPACVRPTHLRLGTNAENVADMIAKGRQARGTAASRAKLTDADVREIKRLAATHSQREVAGIFGINQSGVSRIVTSKRWAHVA